MLGSAHANVQFASEGALLSDVLSPATGERIALGVIVLGFICFYFRRALPRGLGASFFVFGITIGLVLTEDRAPWSTTDPVQRWCLLGATLTLVWTLLGTILSRRRDERDSDSPSGVRSATSPDAPAQTEGTPEALLAWGLLSGAATVAGIAYLLVRAAWPRIISPNFIHDALPAEGLWTIAILLGAVVVRRMRGAANILPSIVLGLAALLAFWISLMIPSASLADEIPPALRLPLQPGWWTWTLQLQVGMAAVVVVAAFVQDHLYRRRLRFAWPDRLDDLLGKYGPWPAYIQIESTIAAMVLILGTLHIVRCGASVGLPLISAASSIAVGAACLFMSYRRWSGNTSSLGMALVSLGVASLSPVITLPFCSLANYPTYGDRLPVVFNAVLFGLLAMVLLWNWLARVWRQQLLDTKPWTTTGRMIPYAKRTAFILAAIAMLVAYQMTLWAERTLTADEDNSPARMVWGLLAIGLYVLFCSFEARRRNSVSWATLAVVFGVAGLLFIFLRASASSFRGWIVQYDAVVVGAAAVPVLLVAEALPKTQWRSFAAPLWFMALLVLPLKSLVSLLPGNTLPEDWVRPVALAILSIVYFVAGGREYRRAFLVLGAVLLAASGTGVYRLYWS